jgi:hypothetical protein
MSDKGVHSLSWKNLYYGCYGLDWRSGSPITFPNKNWHGALLRETWRGGALYQMKENMTFAEKDLAGLLRSLQTLPSPIKEDFQSGSDLVILITSPTFGNGTEHLGKILMKFFLKSLSATPLKPKMLILLNDAVLMACENTEYSEMISSFTILQEQGIKILIEGTSVDYHQVEDKIKCGQVVSMLSICGEILSSGRVLTL